MVVQSSDFDFFSWMYFFKRGRKPNPLIKPAEDYSLYKNNINTKCLAILASSEMVKHMAKKKNYYPGSAVGLGLK